MNNKWQIRNNYLIWFSIILVAFSSVFMYLMYSYASTKNVIITEISDSTFNQDEQQEETKPANHKWNLSLLEKEGEWIEVVCPANVTEGNVTKSIRYDLNTLTLTIKGFDTSLMKDAQPEGNFSYIKAGYGEWIEGAVSFSFEAKAVCEWSIDIDEDIIRVKPLPYNKGDKPVVVIDPGHGGDSFGTRVGTMCEKDISLAIANAVSKMAEDRAYRVMLTRNADEYMDTLSRLNVCEMLGADAYLGIHLSQSIDIPDEFGMSVSYNPTYYDREITNSFYAGKILEKACIATSNKGIGVYASSGEDDYLLAMSIPAAVLYAGYMTNPDELKLLSNEAYIEKVAKGIVAALDELYVSGKLSIER